MDFVFRPKMKVSKRNKLIYKFSDCFQDAIWQIYILEWKSLKWVTIRLLSIN